jgi:hypothetical protein
MPLSKRIVLALVPGIALAAASCTTVYVVKCPCGGEADVSIARADAGGVPARAAEAHPAQPAARRPSAVAGGSSASGRARVDGPPAHARQASVAKAPATVKRAAPVPPRDGVFVEETPHSRVETLYRDGLRHGPERGSRTWGTPSRWYEGTWVNGVMTGTWTSWYANGQIQSVREFVDGKVTGVARTYHSNGQIETESVYEAGLDVAPTKGFYDDGRAEFVMPYVAGLRQGEAIWFHRDGSVRAKGMYADGVLDGAYTEYDTAGAPVLSERWVRGSLASADRSPR